MVIVFIGPPGSGKGTQAKKLADKLGFLYLSTGKMLRDRQSSRPELAEIMNRGELIPDETLMPLFLDYLEKRNAFDNLIVDGSPRSVVQYDKMQKMFRKKGSEIKWAIFLNIGKYEVVGRLSARRQDRKSGKIYNLVTNPPGPDVDIENLITRDDDKPGVIEERFEEYLNETKPLIERLRRDGILIELNGEEPIDVIFEKMLKKLRIQNVKK